MNAKSLKQFVERETDGHLRLAKHATDDDGKNLLLSPLSIHIVLAMTVAGSSGSARAQLLSYLKSERVEQLNSSFSHIAGTVLADGSALGGPVLSAKNGLWVDQSLTLKPAYRDIVHNSYKAAAEPADFQNNAEEARKVVNDWAKKESKGLIEEIIPECIVTEYTRLILANAVYFKGEWVEPFDPELTRDRYFYLLDGTRFLVPSMSSWDNQFAAAFDGFKVAKLPYKHGKDHNRRFSMCIYLPDAADGLPSLMERICSEPGFIDRHLPLEKVELDAFRIPKFKIAFKFEASKVLKRLGVVDLFEMGGLTEMVDSEYSRLLKVDVILHKAFVEVNEAGSEAAAVTVACDDMGCGMMEEEKEKEPKMRFVADHPFLFLIREERSGVVLFVGKLLDPLSDAEFK